MGDLGNIIHITTTAPPSGRFQGHIFGVQIGRCGATKEKREGDGKTPLGVFALRRVLWRADRLAAPQTALACQPIKREDGWCDERADSNYNRAVRLPYGASAESLWRCDSLYDIIVVLDFNDNPVCAGAGSAIFMHLLAEDAHPTEGCVAFSQRDMLRVLARADLSTKVEIR